MPALTRLPRKLPPIETRFSATRHAPKPVSLKRDAAELEQLIMKAARQPKVRVVDLTALVRAFCQLAECIRVLRGLPLPGQLRPDLDPQQLSRAIKRMKQKLPLDIGSSIEAPSEKEETSDQGETSESKESLSHQGTVGTGPGAGADQTGVGFVLTPRDLGSPSDENSSGGEKGGPPAVGG